MQLPGEPQQFIDGYILAELARPAVRCCLGGPVADAVDAVALVLARCDVEGACCFILVVGVAVSAEMLGRLKCHHLGSVVLGDVCALK